MPIEARTLATMTTPCTGTSGNDESIGGNVVIAGEENSGRATMKVGHYTIVFEEEALLDLLNIASRVLPPPSR